MIRNYLLIVVLILQFSISAQETPDVLLQLNAKSDSTFFDDDAIGEKIATLSLITKQDGHLVSRTKNNEIVWQLSIQVLGAKAIVPYFDELVLNDGAKIRAFSKSSKRGTRYFYGNQNTETKSFALPLIKGDKVVIEIVFPNKKVYNQFDLSISEVGALFSTQGFGDAPNCYVNVKCSEAIPYQDQVRSVAKYMTVKGTTIGSCSGSLINNTNQDCENYFLSAQHCGIGSTTAEFGQFVFYFNYEANSCTSPANDNGLDQQTVVGCTKIAASGTSTSMPPDGSDFLLMKINAIPASYNVYYAGWNRSDIPQIQGNGVIIQHPEGDLKKIAFWSTVETSFTASSHLEVIGVSSTHGEGLVQPKSSGSPVFDGNKNIIGNVTAGSDGCVSDYAAGQAGIIAGKLRNHWDQNGTTANLQLKPWLDPINTGVMSLNGKQQCAPISINEVQNKASFYTIFPNPTTQFITIDSDQSVEKIKLYSIDGKLLLTTKKTNNIDISTFHSGMLIVEVYMDNGEIVHSKLLKK